MSTKDLTSEKALAILKKNLNVWQLIELVTLLSAEIEKQSQKLMAEQE